MSGIMSHSQHSRKTRSVAASQVADTEVNLVTYLDSDAYNISIESFKHDKTLAAKAYVYLVKDPVWSFRIGVARIMIKLLSCVLYVAGRIVDDVRQGSPECTDFNATEHCEYFCPTVDDSPYNCSVWENLLWLHREEGIWIAQLIVSIACMAETSLYLYIGAVFTHWRVVRIFNRYHFLDFLNGIPFLLGIIWPSLVHIFVPVFLNIWSAKLILTIILSDVYKVLRQEESQLAHKAFVLASTIASILFTSTCFIHHLQRIAEPWDLFSSLWFVVVTITTVGYGDRAPSRWPGQLYVIIMILSALYILPSQIESLTAILRTRRIYGTPPKKSSNHVVVIGHLSPQDLHDLLSEIYAYHRLQNLTVVILSPVEPNADMQLLLNVPIYRRRVVYLYGSALKEHDLQRAEMTSASSVFIIGDHGSNNHQEEDQRTIIRAWAVRDFAPQVRMFVQLFERRNKFHVNFAEHILCLDEIKHALLATSCVCPGASTFLTLLLHTSRVKEGDKMAPWHDLYGRCSANEIYDIVLSESSIFSRFAGKNFLFAASWVYRKSSFMLIGLRPADSKDIILNPGREYILRPSDRLFYIASSREENTVLNVPPPRVRPALRSMCATIASCHLLFVQMYGRFEGKCKKDQCNLRKQMARLKCAAQGPTMMSSQMHLCSASAGSGSAVNNHHHHHHDSSDQIDGGHLSRIDAFDHGPPPAMLTPQMSRASMSHPPHRDFHGMDAVAFMRDIRNIQDSELPHIGGASPSANRLARLRRGISKPHSETSNLSDDTHKLLAVPGQGDDVMGTTRFTQMRVLEKRRQSAAVVQRNEDILGMARPIGLEELAVEVPLSEALTEDEQDELQQLEVGEEMVIESDSDDEDLRSVSAWASPESYVIGEPRHIPYLQGKNRVRCHLLREDKEVCCLELHKSCQHMERSSPGLCQFRKAVIVGCADADHSLFTFVTTLRANYIKAEDLKPIILLIKTRPTDHFLRMFSCFPKLAFMIGSYSKLDDLLLAGIMLAEAVIVLGKRKEAEEIFMVDASTVVGVQKLYRFFPNANIITLLSHRSNMRFMNTKCLHRFNPADPHLNVIDGHHQTKVTRNPGDHLHYMFQPQFAAGDVFTSSMLDTLLYQTYVKPWLMDLVRQLIGCKQNEKHQCFLRMVNVTSNMLRMKTYGRVMLHHTFKTGDLVIGIYRTLPPRNPEIMACQLVWMNDVTRVVGTRMLRLGIPGTPPCLQPRGQSFVLVNPPHDTKMHEGDKLYVLRATGSKRPEVIATPPGTPTGHRPSFSTLFPDAPSSGAAQQQQHHYHHHHHHHHHEPNLQTVAEVISPPDASTPSSKAFPSSGTQSSPIAEDKRRSSDTPKLLISSDSVEFTSLPVSGDDLAISAKEALALKDHDRMGPAAAFAAQQTEVHIEEDHFAFLDQPFPAPSTYEGQLSGYMHPTYPPGVFQRMSSESRDETAV